MNWEQKAVEVCEERGFKVLGFEGGLVFIEDPTGVWGVRECVVAKWINGRKGGSC